ncbi:Dyp-type peroxidase [Corynebacterium lizhenjunii]|uniref:Dyp-type peroxidase n=1 Tax=Corynebacterium lizhenjunii TaxID=2709394 RepID=A0A7T0KDT1_9CORY|nr:Dyp-type peroxidase [Corynebacterium lizhenjunii]QPK78249.1 Dyp-type peroxidase [Corynebacterium lizhenjunii]
MAQRVNRRTVLAGSALGVGALAAGCSAEGARRQAGGNGAAESADAPAPAPSSGSPAQLAGAIVPFDGQHQAGVDTASQAHLNLVGFNLLPTAGQREARNLMRLWTEDARALCTAEAPLGSLEPEMVRIPANLTITCGWGEGFFHAAGIDAPEWLGPVKEFSLDQLRPEWGQTDVVLQICGDDAVTTAHAMRHMVRAAKAYAAVAWVQQGFLNAYGALEKGATPRNLFGQKDGTVNPRSPEEFAQQVWIPHGRFAGGTAMVVRRIAMNLDTWEELDRTAREVSVGRDLVEGAPLGAEGEFDPVDLEARDRFGLRAIDPTSHVALAHPPAQAPEQKLLRRPYNYDLAPDEFTRASGQLSNAGLVFICFQQDPRSQFEPIQQRLNDADQLNTWTTHIGSSMYYVPAGTSRDTSWGEHLL